MYYKVLYNKGYGGFCFSDEARQRLKEIGLDTYTVRRHDPRLISIVEEIGLERASGSYSNLQIAEIDYNLYQIREYDGSEKIVVPNDLEWTDATDY